MYKIVFSKKSLQETDDARRWYNKQQHGLGKRFVSDVQEVIKDIKANPFFASVKFKTIRTAACKIFPYTVHYEIDEKEKLVRILSVFHISRKPYWMEDIASEEDDE
jgi:toxin ParE1/3/4